MIKAQLICFKLIYFKAGISYAQHCAVLTSLPLPEHHPGSDVNYLGQMWAGSPRCTAAYLDMSFPAQQQVTTVV